MAETSNVDPEYRRYTAEIDLYEKEFRPWETRGKRVVKIFKDADNRQGKKKRFNVLWSNVETLKPALYAREPQPVSERRHKDADPVGRVASEVLERCLAYTVDCQDYGTVMRQVVQDRLLPGRGTCWFRYSPSFEDGEDSDELSYEEAVPDYVYWEDFGHNIARTWAEVTMVWRKVYMDRAKLVKRFGKVGQEIPLDYSPKGLKDEKIGEDIKKACIFELWDRETGEVVFLSRMHPRIIEQKPAPIKLTNGFPCPRPLFATLTNDALVPVPDYALYQTQATEIERLTRRIDKLQDGLKLAGVYDASAPELGRLLGEGYENKLIPVDKWAAFAEKGGIEGAIDFLPIKEIAEVLIGLYEAREKAKEDLYEITGIADIIRGNSEPNETATAQQIKGRFAVLRISDAQQDVQRFARDGMRIMGEIIAENFDLETIKQMSGVRLLMAAEKQQIAAQMQQEQQMQQQMQMMAQQQGAGQPQGGPPPPPPPPSQIPEDMRELMDQPTWEEVHELLSHQVLREFRIDIETDSTIRTDEEADRAQRTEFLTAAGTYLRQATEASQQAPELKPLLSELLMFGIRGHRAARNLEPVFDDAMKQIQKPKPPKPDPEVMKIEAQTKLKEQEMQLDVQAEQAKQQAQHQEEMARQQMEDQRAERELERTTELERFKAELDVQLMREKAQLEAQTKLQIAGIQAQQKEREIEFSERTRAEDREAGEAKKKDEGERKQSREAMLAKAAELVEALSALRSQVH